MGNRGMVMEEFENFFLVDRWSPVKFIFKNKAISTLIWRVIVVYFVFLFSLVSYSFHCFQ